MEIEVGEYVRTRMGTIGKFKYYGDDKENIYFKNDRGTTCVYEKEIVKHSKDIIDLIEEGDYVNGYLVKDVVENLQTGELHLEMPMDYTNQELGDCTIYNKDIKSIVTKEQIKQIEYIIKE